MHLCQFIFCLNYCGLSPLLANAGLVEVDGTGRAGFQAGHREVTRRAGLFALIGTHRAKFGGVGTLIRGKGRGMNNVAVSDWDF